MIIRICNLTIKDTSDHVCNRSTCTHILKLQQALINRL